MTSMVVDQAFGASASIEDRTSKQLKEYIGYVGGREFCGGKKEKKVSTSVVILLVGRTRIMTQMTIGACWEAPQYFRGAQF